MQLGGDSPQVGIIATLQQGDIVLIPAGVAHKCITQSADFAVVGAYSNGQQPDMMYGKAGERPGADSRIAALQIPTMDPVLGKQGIMQTLWVQ